jgi:hypothetical protein
MAVCFVFYSLLATVPRGAERVQEKKRIDSAKSCLCLSLPFSPILVVRQSNAIYGPKIVHNATEWDKNSNCQNRHTLGSLSYTGVAMDVEQVIAEIERLERIFAVPDTRPLTPSDISAANRRHDQMQARSPWFRLWQRYGVCCRTESPVIHLPEAGS